jgi:predicted RNA binding protein YcfA (HicA-like mRNA interferase family)
LKKLSPIAPEKLIKILKKQGFEEIRQRGSHKFLRDMEGRTAVIPFHKSEKIGRGLLSKILKDIGIIFYLVLDESRWLDLLFISLIL